MGTGTDGSKAILLVDDEAIIVLALSRELRAAFGGEYRIETALNAEEAFEVISDLEREGCELVVVISDWLMPGMRGDDFLIAVRQTYPAIALIMVTGQADEKAVERVVREAKVLACIRKPWRGSEIIELIRSATKA
ncbi:MAG TPA: response regulator [bacterium]|nr:response regulator [bacterium]